MLFNVMKHAFHKILRSDEFGGEDFNDNESNTPKPKPKKEKKLTEKELEKKES